MRIRHSIIALLFIGTATYGCNKTPDAKPAAPPAEANAPAEPTAAAEAAKVGANAVAPATAEPVAAAPAPAEPAAAAPAPGDAFGAWKAAMDGIGQCETAEDKVKAKDANACLAPLEAARKLLDHPTDVPADQVGKRKIELRKQVGRELGLYISDRHRITVYYALTQARDVIDMVPSVRARLEQLMADDHPATAREAAVVLFWRPTKDDTARIELAKATMANHKTESARIAACEFLGYTPTFKGERGHFDLLAGLVKDTSAPQDLRRCAVRGMGAIGDETDVTTLAALLKDPTVQQAAWQAVTRAKGKAGFDAAVGFLAANAKKPGALLRDTVAAVAPYGPVPADFPTAKAAKALLGIVVDKAQDSSLRSAAVESLGRLKAKAELEKAKAAWEGATDVEGKILLDKVTEALAKAG